MRHNDQTSKTTKWPSAQKISIWNFVNTNAKGVVDRSKGPNFITRLGRKLTLAEKNLDHDLDETVITTSKCNFCLI